MGLDPTAMRMENRTRRCVTRTTRHNKICGLLDHKPTPVAKRPAPETMSDKEMAIAEFRYYEALQPVLDVLDM